MAQACENSHREELDDYVREFELAYARDGRAEIAEFLPPRGHPLRESLLRELVRVDLEYGWETGRPRAVSDYLRAFPELWRDPVGLREISYEEFRQRREASVTAPDASRPRDDRMGLDGPGPRGGDDPGPDMRGREPVGDDGLPPGEMERAALSYRDFRLHHHDGDTTALESWCASFSGRVDHARLFRDVHLSDPRAAELLARGLTTLPRVGDVFVGFRLLAELGRGGFGKVYLALQADLADRPVALKVSPELSGESQMLAQLQHTNIVPIYSTHRVEPLQAVCMPYFGSTTLRHVLDDLKGQEALPLSGRGLLSALSSRKGDPARGGDTRLSGAGVAEGHHVVSGEAIAAAPPPMQSGASGDTLRLLEGLSYVKAVLWTAARLADGLAHAHERGILHRDLKPANILLTDEGQPMLLDFNLSEDSKVRTGAVAAVGGTLPYMAPEHLDALRGGASPDARSDLYSLGVILYELLTARRPFASPEGPPGAVLGRMIQARLGPPPGLHHLNKAVTPAVESIVRHLLEPDPGRRYQTAHELHEDLERHLADRPLRHAPEPSPRERIGKWARRHPVLSSSTSIALLAAALMTAVGTAGWLVTEASRVDAAGFHHQEFREDFKKCQLLLNTHGGPSGSLDQGIFLARQALDGYGVDRPGDWTAAPLVRRLPEADRRALREEVSELIQLEARARVVVAKRAGSAAEVRDALQEGVASLDHAERFDPRPPASLYEDRSRYHAALGQGDRAARDHALAASIPATSSRDFYLLGTSRLADRQPDRAEPLLSKAVSSDAPRFWAWFALGICHFDQGRYADAAYDFSVCTTLAPDFAWPHLNRGLSLARSGRLPEARVAYDRALSLDGNFTEALVDRALACLELDDYGQALRDLDRALALGRQPPSVHAARAEALARLGRHAEAERAFATLIQAHPDNPMLPVARGFSRLSADPAGARADFARTLILDPKNARAHLGRALLLRGVDNRTALAEVEMALSIDPDFLDALQARALLRARLGDPAAEADVYRLLQAPTPQRFYNAACVLALLSRSAADHRLVPRAVDLLQQSLDSGLTPKLLAEDPDLDALRGSPQFLDLYKRSSAPPSPSPSPDR